MTPRVSTDDRIEAPGAEALVVEPVTGRIGAEIVGLDLSGDLSDAVIAAVRDTVLRYRVVFLRDQHLDMAGQTRFAERFGPLTIGHPTLPGPDDFPQVVEFDALSGARADHWHTDVTFADRPPTFSVLRVVVIPRYGGDTMWANTVAAYADLPGSLQHFVDGLRAVHTNTYDYANPRNAPVGPRRRHLEVFTATVFETEHPVVRIHPETDERALLLGGFAQRLVGLPADESRNLLHLLADRITRPENTVRWRWRTGDVAMWDNRSTQHYAINDYDDAPRTVQRVTVAGAIPIGIDGRPSRALAGDAAPYSVIGAAWRIPSPTDSGPTPGRLYEPRRGPTSSPKAAIWSHSSSTDRPGNAAGGGRHPRSMTSARFSAICSGDPETVPRGSSQVGVAHMEDPGQGADGDGRSVAQLLAELEELGHLGLAVRSAWPSGAASRRRGRGPAQRRTRGTAHPDRGTGPLDRTGPDAQTAGRPPGPGEHRELVDQGGGDAVDGFVESFAPVEELGPEDVELLEDVAGTDADDQTSAGQPVEGGELLGRPQRMAQGGDVDVGQQPDPGGDPGQPSEGGHGVVPGGAHGLGQTLGNESVVADGDVEEAGVVGLAGDTGQLGRARRWSPSPRGTWSTATGWAAGCRRRLCPRE